MRKVAKVVVVVFDGWARHGHARAHAKAGLVRRAESVVPRGTLGLPIDDARRHDVGGYGLAAGSPWHRGQRLPLSRGDARLCPRHIAGRGSGAGGAATGSRPAGPPRHSLIAWRGGPFARHRPHGLSGVGLPAQSARSRAWALDLHNPRRGCDADAHSVREAVEQYPGIRPASAARAAALWRD